MGRGVSPASEGGGTSSGQNVHAGCTQLRPTRVLHPIFQTSVVDGALVVDVLVSVVVVGVVCYDGCEQSAVHSATAVLGRVGRPRGRYYYTSNPPACSLQPIR